MKIAGSFVVEIRANQKSEKETEIVKAEVDRLVRIVDPEAVLEIKTFTKLLIILTWSGIPLHLGKAQRLFKYLKTSPEKFFNAYKLLLKIDFKEEGF